jgi:hypothetical protein
MNLRLAELMQEEIDTEHKIRLLEFHLATVRNQIVEIANSEPKPFVDDHGRTVRLHEYPGFGTAREVYLPQSNKWFHEDWIE